MEPLVKRHSRKYKKNSTEQDSVADSLREGDDPLYGRRSLRRRAVRVIGGLFLLPVILLLILGGLGLYLFQGQEFSNSTIDNQVEASLQAVLGDDYEIRIGRTGLSLISTSIVTLNGKQVEIFKSANGNRIALLDEVRIGINSVSLFSGKPRFDQLVIEGGSVDTTQMDERQAPGGFQRFLKGIAKQMIEVSAAFSDDMIDSVEITNLTINGARYGQRDPDNNVITVRKALLDPDASGGFSLNAGLSSKFSEFSMVASWRQGDNDEGYDFFAGLGPFSSREWLAPADPVAALAEGDTSGIGLATMLRADIRISYDAELKPGEPYLKLQAEGGELRLGKGQTMPLGFAVANIRSNLRLSEIALERAEFSLGELSFDAKGSINRIKDDSPGNPWNLRFDFDNFRGTGPYWQTGDNAATLALDGRFSAASKTLDIASLKLADGEGSSLLANAVVNFHEGMSPAIRGGAETPAIDIRTLQRFWPFHVAPNFRHWLQTRVMKGTARNLDLVFSIGEGRLNETVRGKGFSDEEFRLTSELSSVSLQTIGTIPEVTNANGTLSMVGSVVDISNATGRLDPPGEGVVDLEKADFLIADVFQPDATGRLKALFTGKLAPVASLANAEPLKIAEKIAITPAKLSGTAKADIDVQFPLSSKQPAKEVKWQADVELLKASSSIPFFGQTFKNANIRISANPTLVTAKGKANANGFDISVDLAEPINGGPSSKRFRNISATVDHKSLASQGIDISSVATGNMAVTIRTDAKNNDRYEIDLTNADVSLPWISWLKGKGIPAKASFILSQKDGINTLSDFSFLGSTFKAAGRLSFNKSGLLSADLKNVVLVRGDLFDVNVARKGNTYKIAANGRSFDGRSLINKIIHEDGISGVASKADVSLTANFGRLVGFNSQVMENALVRYQTEQGLLLNLEVRGAQGGQLSKIDAGRRGANTTFRFESDNAGAALAIVDLYRKMEGGKLNSRLIRNGDGPFKGNVAIKDFVVVGEERLKSLVSAPVEDSRIQEASGKLREINVQRVRFDDLKASIEKDDNFFAVQQGRLRNGQIGLTFDGTIYDTQDQMSVRGTFMPLFAISRLIGEIPIIGDIFSNGKNSGLIGITYRLKGQADNPTILVNPVSIIAPGIFKEIFQFQR